MYLKTAAKVSLLLQAMNLYLVLVFYEKLSTVYTRFVYFILTPTLISLKEYEAGGKITSFFLVMSDI